MAYQIFADATADLTDSILEKLPSVEVIPMGVDICNCNYTYGPGGELNISAFYEMQREGNFAATSQINPATYIQYFELVVQQGKHIAAAGLADKGKIQVSYAIGIAQPVSVMVDSFGTGKVG